LLCHVKGGMRGYTGTGLRDGIQALFRSAEVRDADGRTPRVHDFRHNSECPIIPSEALEGAKIQAIHWV
jgi:integrase/recombinase XerD